jgi:hypothetical protein
MGVFKTDSVEQTLPCRPFRTHKMVMAVPVAEATGIVYFPFREP